MTRLAICFSGQCRDPKKLWPNFEQYIFAPLRQVGQIDIFLHFWEQGNKCKDLTEVNSRKTILSLFQPTKFIFEPQKEFQYKFQSMFYSIMMANSLVGPQYDYVLRMRTDIAFHEPLLKNYLDNNIYVRFGIQNTINDQFAIGPRHLMQQYAKCYSFIEKHGIQNVGTNPEGILYNFFMEAGLLPYTKILPNTLFWRND